MKPFAPLLPNETIVLRPSLVPARAVPRLSFDSFYFLISAKQFKFFWTLRGRVDQGQRG